MRQLEKQLLGKKARRKRRKRKKSRRGSKGRKKRQQVGSKYTENQAGPDTSQGEGMDTSSEKIDRANRSSIRKGDKKRDRSIGAKMVVDEKPSSVAKSGTEDVDESWSSDEEALFWAHVDGLKMRLQNLRRDQRLCRICHWEEDSTTNDTRFPPPPSAVYFADETHDDDDDEGLIRAAVAVKMSVSKTNLNDLRQYVKANIRSFTRAGGCALFLEALISIAGERYVRRALKRCAKSPTSLIACSCTERHAVDKSNRGRIGYSAEPTFHDCDHVPLLSLLLTGKIKGNPQTFSSIDLGIGMLTMPREHPWPGHALLCPTKPVWIVRRDRFYSVIRVYQDMPDLDGFTRKGYLGLAPTKMTEPDFGAGNSFTLALHNPWYGAQTSSRMIVYPPKKDTVDGSVINADSSQIETVIAHPEDQRYYGDFRRWRFSFDGASSWSPYYRLSARKRIAVDAKLGSKLNQIIGTKWTGAFVELRRQQPSNKDISK